MAPPNSALGYFFGVFLECVVFGVFLSFFIATCYVQWEKSSKGRGVNRFMVIVTGFVGISTTAHLVIGLRRAVRAVWETPPGAAIHLTRGPPFPADGIASFIILQIQATVTDMIVVYRIYFIYNRNVWVCIAPSVVILAFVADNCGHIYQLLEPVFNRKALRDWSIAFFCFTIFNSVYMTSAIGLRLWLVHRETVKAGVQVDDSIIMRAMRVFIESAALWTTFASINLFVSLTGSHLVQAFAAMSSPILGICFCLIIVRLGQVFPVAQEETWHPSIHTPSSRSRGSNRVSVSFPKVDIRQDVCEGDSKDFPMETLESQKQEYVGSSNEPPKVFRPSLSLSPHT